MSAVEKFILENIFVTMIRSTPPQYSILLCLWQQQGQLGKAAFNMMLVKACQIINFPTRGCLPQQTSHSKVTSFSGHWINENLSEVRCIWDGSTPTPVGASHSRGSPTQWQLTGTSPRAPSTGALHTPREVWNTELGIVGSSILSERANKLCCACKMFPQVAPKVSPPTPRLVKSVCSVKNTHTQRPCNPFRRCRET